jgi:hypothetical protein
MWSWIAYSWSDELLVFNVMPQITSESGTSFQFHVLLTCIYESSQLRMWIFTLQTGKLKRLQRWSPPHFQSLELHMLSFQMEKWVAIHHSSIRNASFPSLPGTGQHFLGLGISSLYTSWSRKWKWVELMFASSFFVHKRESTCSWNKQMWKHFSLIKMFTASSEWLTVEPVMDPSATNPPWEEYIYCGRAREQNFCSQAQDDH